MIPLSRHDPKIDEQLDGILIEAGAGAAAIVAIDGDRTYAKLWGTRAADGGSIDETTGFLIASVSKSFTATAAAALVAEGRVGWDDPVRSHLPDFASSDAYVTANATLRDLLANRVGFSRDVLAEGGLDPGFGVSDQLRRIAQTPISHKFRHDFAYSNQGFLIAAALIARVMGASYDAALRRLVLDPLGMTRTGSGAAALNRLNDLATGRLFHAGRQHDRPIAEMGLMDGASGIVTCARDMALWLRLHARRCEGQGVFDTAALSELTIPHVPNRDPPNSMSPPGTRFHAYGLGWALALRGEQPLILHGGGEVGWLSHVAILPRRGIGVAVMLACHPSSACLRISYGLLAWLESGQWADWWSDLPTATPEPTCAEPDLDQYAGCYGGVGAGIVRVSLEGDQLLMCLEDSAACSARLRPLGRARFAAESIDPVLQQLWFQHLAPTVSFEKDGGRVTGLRGSLFGYVGRI